MGSLYLNQLNSAQRRDLILRLNEAQNGKCFICGDPIDVDLHAGSIDIDHVEPLKVGGRDDPTNFAVTHAACNRAKQASDLRVARVLARFTRIREQLSPENRGPNLGDILRHYAGRAFRLTLRRTGNIIFLSFPEIGRNEVLQLPLFRDDLSGLEYFFAKLPIAYLHHDERINPRAVGGSLSALVEEFHKKRPQLHVALAWATIDEEGSTQVHVFDGQHKATAQILLGIKELPVRIFLNPNLDLLLTTNTNAGTTLRQVAFDKSVQRHLGSALFVERIERYRRDRSLPPDFEDFSEKDLVNHFKGEWREMRRYIIDNVRDSVTHHPDNKLRDFIDFGGKSKEKPFAYSAIEKTFYSFFIFGDLLETPFSFLAEEGENPRDLEREQIVKLMNIIADVLYVGKFDPTLGSHRIENRIQKDEDIPDEHLRGHRMAREEILYSWLRFVRQIVQNHFIVQGKPIQEEKLFHYRFPEPLWDHIENFVTNLGKLPLWVNRELSLSIFGGKQNYDYWQTIFETGKTPQGQRVLPEALNLMKMIQ